MHVISFFVCINDIILYAGKYKLLIDCTVDFEELGLIVNLIIIGKTSSYGRIMVCMLTTRVCCFQC